MDHLARARHRPSRAAIIAVTGTSVLAVVAAVAMLRGTGSSASGTRAPELTRTGASGSRSRRSVAGPSGGAAQPGVPGPLFQLSTLGHTVALAGFTDLHSPIRAAGRDVQ